MTDGCKDCHEGAANKKMYLHHIDRGYSPTGNPSLDAVPIQTCKSCHNQDGYAAVRKCTDGSAPVSNGASPAKTLAPTARRTGPTWSIQSFAASTACTWATSS